MLLRSALFVFLAALSAQPGSMSIVDQEAVVATLEHDRAQLAGWSWNLETEIRLEGQLEQVQLERAKLDEHGRIHRTPSGAAGGQPPHRARMPKKLAEAVEALKQLTDSYASPDPQTLRAALTHAHAWPSADGQVLRIQSRDVLRRSDSMDLVVERSTKRLLECSILSSLAGEPIRLDVRYAVLEGGPFLPIVVDVKTELGERELTLHTESSAATKG